MLRRERGVYKLRKIQQRVASGGARMREFLRTSIASMNLDERSCASDAFPDSRLVSTAAV